MAEKYKVKIISTEERNKMMFNVYSEELYQLKANIHGACIKFFTDNPEFKNMWEENFKPMSEDIRPHGRVFCLKDKSKKLKVYYDPLSKTAIIKNCNYYGWVKSIALGVVADFFEDFLSEHRRYSIHGSFVDHGGRGLAIVGPSKSGKTTLTYGLLLDRGYSFLTDDWFFVRFNDRNVRVYSSEKNSYIRDDLAENWPKFKNKLMNLKKDAKGRSIVDVTRVFGSGRVRQESVMKMVVILKREKGKQVWKKLNVKEALQFMKKNDFCNPHQLVRNKRKMKERTEFFKELFSKVPVYLLNTIETPKESLERIKRLSDRL